MKRPLQLGFALLLLCAAAGCRTSAPAEASIRPGVNAEYLKPDLDPSQWVERFEREGREIFDQRERIVQSLRLRPGMRVGDVGAGTGLFTPYFSQAVGASGRVYAVDIVPRFVELIGERARQRGWSNVSPVLCTDRDARLPANSVDLVFLCDVYHHLEYPQSTLRSIHRALRRGGQLVIIDFKRVPGESSDWVLNHVRAGEETVTAEIEAGGFRKAEAQPLLRDNYWLRFEKR